MIEASLRYMRIMHAAFIGAIFLYLYVLIAVVKPRGRSLDQTTFYSLTAVALLNTAIALLYFRARRLPDAEEVVRNNPNERAAIVKLQSAYIASFALCESSFLLGWVMTFMGEPLNRTGIAMAVGFLGLLLCAPRRP